MYTCYNIPLLIHIYYPIRFYYGVWSLLAITSEYHLSADEIILQEELVSTFPLLSEANAMAEEMEKRVKFELALISPQAQGKTSGRTEVSVTMFSRKL